MRDCYITWQEHSKYLNVSRYPTTLRTRNWCVKLPLEATISSATGGGGTGGGGEGGGVGGGGYNALRTSTTLPIS